MTTKVANYNRILLFRKIYWGRKLPLIFLLIKSTRTEYYNGGNIVPNKFYIRKFRRFYGYRFKSDEEKS